MNISFLRAAVPIRYRVLIALGFRVYLVVDAKHQVMRSTLRPRKVETLLATLTGGPCAPIQFEYTDYAKHLLGEL